MKSYQEAIIELDRKIPRDVISQRSGGQGRMLSYLEGHYVIDRLNKILGQGNWGYNSHVSLLHSGLVKDRFGNDVHSVHYSASVNFVFTVPGGITNHFTDYGYGDGTDKLNPGKAHELAIKESITDGLKRCAKNLGMSMGLALYSKEQENVDDGEVEAEPTRRDSPVRAAKAPEAAPAKPVEAASTPVEKDKLIELIARYIKVARAQKKSEVTKTYFTGLGVTNPDELTKLTIEQLNTSKKYLEELTK